MNIKRLNWPLWLGFLLTIFAFLSYPFIFVNFPVTRDFPWANLLLFTIAVALILIGLRRAFSADRRLFSKIMGVLVTSLSALIIGLFIFIAFIEARWLPASKAAPHVGQKAPEFSLKDTNGTVVTLSGLLTSQMNGKPPKGVLLIFYRGYW